MLALIFLAVSVLASWEDELTKGSIGGYFTPSELNTYLNALKANFTNLISTGQATSTSVKSLPIYYAQLSATAGLSSDERTTVMITAGQSAEQPIAVTQALYLLAKWANDYATSSKAFYWLQTQRIYFVPMINPDAYSELANNTVSATVPAGRVKNLKDNSCTTTAQQGTNLDRNYNTQYNYDSVGSSNDTCSTTYRGTAALSEPETAAVDELRKSWNPRLWIHIDGTGDYRIMPYSYSSNASLAAEDLSFYNAISSSLGGLKTRAAAYGSAANGALLDYAYANGAISFLFSTSSSILSQGQILGKVKGDVTHYETLTDYASPQWK
jgi:hypothetical protein